MSIRKWLRFLPTDVIEDQVDSLLQVIVVKSHHPGYYPPISIVAVTEVDQDPILAAPLQPLRDNCRQAGRALEGSPAASLSPAGKLSVAGRCQRCPPLFKGLEVAENPANMTA